MKDSDDELKDFFSGNPHEEQFEFDPQNWEKFNTSLKKKRTDRKRLLIYLNLLLLMIGITATWLVMEKESAGKNTDGLAAASAKMNEANVVTNNKNEITHSLSPKDTKPIRDRSASGDAKQIGDRFVPKDATPVHDRSADQLRETGAPGIDHDARAEKSKTETKVGLSNPVNSKAGTKTNGGSGVTSEKRGKASQITEKTLSEKNHSPAKVNLTKQDHPAKIKREQATQNPGTQSAANDTRSEIQSKGNSSIILSQRAKTKAAKPLIEQGSDKSDHTTDNSDAPATSVSFENKDAVVVTASTAPVNDELTGRDKPAVPDSNTGDQISVTTETVVSAPLADSTLAPIVVNKDSLPKELPSKNLVFFEAGADYLLGWKNNDKTEARGFNPVIGIGYQNAFTDKLALSAGVRYQSLSNFSGTSHTSAVTALKFGEESDVTVISPLRAHYLAVPLKLNYLINSKNSIGFGYTIAYLLDVESKVETYIKSKDYHGDHTVSKSMGYKTGFNSIDGQIAFCYRRQLYRRLHLNCELFYGLNDIKKDKVYNSPVFERSRGLKMTLTYNLIKK
ncbi:MAG: hypothetical protein V4635_07355 [Bacteroidota bacterium]